MEASEEPSKASPEASKELTQERLAAVEASMDVAKEASMVGKQTH
jgi:hypothetical protein